MMKDMSLTDHLTELRGRIIKIVIYLIVFFGLCYNFGDKLQDFLLMPLRSALGSEGKVVFIGLLDKVLTQFQLAFWCSIITSSPLWFRELWLFIRPGLYDNEIKIIRPFIFLGFTLFCLGVSFGYFIVFPFTFETILGFGVSNIEATISLKEYIVLSSKVLVFLGLLFQLPNIILILGLMGAITHQQLTGLRRYVINAFAVVSALITPPDPITMMALWVPLVLLYEIGLLLLKLMSPFIKKQTDMTI